MKNINLSSYAIALLSLSNDEKDKEMFFQLAKKLNDINLQCPELFKFLSDRSINKNVRRQASFEILSELSFDKTFIYWVWIIIDNNMYFSYKGILKEIYSQFNEIFGIENIEVSSPNELTQAQANKITNFLANKLSKKVNLSVKVKPNLIGGIRIKVNNKSYNNTFKYKLENLKKVLISREGE